MDLKNFNLAERIRGTELVAFGVSWDLHNCGVFRQLYFEPATGDIVMEWRPAPECAKSNWGGPSNVATACRLRFSGVTLLQLGERDEAYPTSESDCVSGISIGTDDGRERLVFEFQDKRRIEIAARSVSMERDL
jgi:hypothetical protein